MKKIHGAYLITCCRHVVWLSIFVFSFVLVFPHDSIAEADNCISFQLGKSKNRGSEFIRTLPFSANRQPDSEIYSAIFDLNNDGKSEYFYFLEDRWFCGSSTGCSINVYEYVNGRFRELFKYGIPTFNQFDPRKMDSRRYICISSAATLGWYDVSIQSRTYSYNGKRYIHKKGEK